ncbi:hypothetical protein NIES2100_67340 [Calothrix sp. NIES-2100]|uniref:hypothetical protein n=1 Tax=Calothrix sp. NIES-2100 TaxID=1954172 RepID=UPI000B5EF7F3|nr:hypothetical protein NIES2100_67340 [Calothrix sp. NIES-2100]
MANNNDLTNIKNQEIIVEEINEEELDGVVGGGLTDITGPALGTVFGVTAIVEGVLGYALPALGALLGPKQ